MLNLKNYKLQKFSELCETNKTNDFNIEIFTPTEKYIPEEILSEEEKEDEEMIQTLSESKIFPSNP